MHTSGLPNGWSLRFSDVQLHGEAGIACNASSSLVEGAGVRGRLREWANFVGALT